MSLDYYVALCGALPDVARLNEDLDDLGGTTGTWQTGLNCGGVRIQTMSLDSDRLAMMHEAMSRDGHAAFDLESAVVLVRAPFNTADQIASALMRGIGGVLFSEDYEFVEVYPPEVARNARPQPPREPRIALDFSIPSDVAAHFLEPQQKYYLATRNRITVAPAKVIAEIRPPSTLPIRHSRDGWWDHNEVGPVAVKSTREYGWYKDMLTRIGLERPYEILWITHNRMPDPIERGVWRLVLYMMCALARNTRGVLVNEKAFHDFK